MIVPDFLKLAIKVEEVDDSTLKGVCIPRTSCELECLRSSVSVPNKYDLNIEDSPTINSEVRFTFNPFKNYGHAGYKDFFLNESWWSEKYSDSNRIAAESIVFHLWAEERKSQDLIADDKLHLVCQLALRFSKLAHPSNSKIIFFGKKATEISLKPRAIEDFLETIKNLDELQLQSIIKLSKWLNDDNDRHLIEKKSILSTVISNQFPEVDGNTYSFHHVLIKIPEIEKEISGQYELYLENFSYEKFVKKLEENTEKFTNRVNDTLSKVFTQTLALPIAAASLQALRTDSTVVYIALIIACILCLAALLIQFKALKNIENEVEGFKDKGKIPLPLQKTWRNDEEKIKETIGYQRNLGRLFVVTVFLCIFFSIFQITNQKQSDVKETVSTNTSQNPNGDASLSVQHPTNQDSTSTHHSEESTPANEEHNPSKGLPKAQNTEPVSKP